MLVSRELVLWLLQQGHQPVHLRPGSADSLTAGLEEAILLREQEQTDLSLALLEQMEAAGMSSPWIIDNQARAQHRLGRTSEAAELWRSLIDHSDAAAAGTASDTLKQLQKQLLEGLHHHCSFHNWQPQHLPAPDAPLVDNPLHPALEEAITTREAGQVGLSLALMEEALQQGWESPWVHDNRARALVNLGRRDEAMQVWNTLTAAKDEAAAVLAREALAQQQAQLDCEQQRQEAQLLLQQGKQEEAQALLQRAWLLHPDDAGLLHLLEQAQPSPDAIGGETLHEQELAAVKRRLNMHDGLLSELEQRLSASI